MRGACRGLGKEVVFICKCRKPYYKEKSKCAICGDTKEAVEQREEAAERMEWKEHQEKVRRQHHGNLLLAYTYDILDKIPDYEVSFEERHKDIEDYKERRRKKLDEREADIYAERNEQMLAWSIRRGYEKPPNGMTKTRWLKEYSKKRKLQKEKDKLEQIEKADKARLKRNSPINLLLGMLLEIQPECECEAEEMRQGKFCKICILTGMLKDKAEDLWKDAAEGRSPYV